MATMKTMKTIFGKNKYDQDSFTDDISLMIMPNSITMIININSIISYK